MIYPEDDNTLIKGILGVVWVIVRDALKSNKTLEGHLATSKQFQDNVKRKGESQFIDLLRDTAKRRAWHELFENGNFPRCFRRYMF
jgi:hypothetical protein